jgi:hypothetical protein
MKYILLIYGDEKLGASMTEEQRTEQYNEYNAFTESVRQRGQYAGGEALHPVSSATTVRVRDGKTMTTDGPFAETKEQLGGYYIVDCANLDEAIEAAARIPGARNGSIEVRPVVEFAPGM